jgi:hypothetical protein
LLIYVRKLQPGPDPVVVAGSADLVDVQNEIELIRSRGMLAKAAQALNLVDDDEIAPAPTWLQSLLTAKDAPSTKLESAVEYLRKNVALKQVGASHTILISATTSDPHKSERIANAIADVAVQARVSAEQQGIVSPLLRERVQGLGPSAYVITPAEPSKKKDGPHKILVLAAATILGLAIGAALALLSDLFNRTVRTATQVENFGIECIGAIPKLRSRIGLEGPPSQHTFANERSLRPDAILNQTIRRALAAIEAAKVRTIGVTSAVGGEGATTVAGHLVKMANACGMKALLVQPDPARRDSVRAVSSAAEEGARKRASIASGERVQELNVRGVDGSPGAAAWSRYSGSDALAKYDLLLVDLPPLDHGPEFRLAARDLDGFLLVVKWGDTQFDAIERAIAESGVPISEFIGAVLNMMDERMIGKFGDKLWEAEAALAAGRRPFEFSTGL